GVALGAGQHLDWPAGRPGPVADPQQGTDQRPDHVVTERISHDRRYRQRGPRPGPFQAEQFTDRARAPPAAAEPGEGLLTQARPGRLVHVADGEPPGIPQGLVPPQGVGPGRVVADPVGVPAPQAEKRASKPGGAATTWCTRTSGGSTAHRRRWA